MNTPEKNYNHLEKTKAEPEKELKEFIKNLNSLISELNKESIEIESCLANYYGNYEIELDDDEEQIDDDPKLPFKDKLNISLNVLRDVVNSIRNKREKLSKIM